MNSNADQFKGPQPSPTGHPLPRRSSPQNSVTLQHHRLARDASRRHMPGSVPSHEANPASSRRHSSGESQDTGHSDPKNWFDLSNQNPTATFDHNVMEGELVLLRSRPYLQLTFSQSIPLFSRKNQIHPTKNKPFLSTISSHHDSPPPVAAVQMTTEVSSMT